jgi:uncharacterized FAD-dependent dehydrogenase
MYIVRSLLAGTDRLVRILRAFREHLIASGVDVRFGARVDEFMTGNGPTVHAILHAS